MPCLVLCDCLFNVVVSYVCFVVLLVIVYITSEIKDMLNKGYQFLALGRVALAALDLDAVLFIDNAMQACGSCDGSHAVSN